MLRGKILESTKYTRAHRDLINAIALYIAQDMMMTMMLRERKRERQKTEKSIFSCDTQNTSINMKIYSVHGGFSKIAMYVTEVVLYHQKYYIFLSKKNTEEENSQQHKKTRR